MLPTYDTAVFIEEQREEYIRYYRTDGKRWEVWGRCDYRGDCLEGVPPSELPYLLLPPTERLDVPITPGFKGCCPFQFVELTDADQILSS